MDTIEKLLDYIAHKESGYTILPPSGIPQLREGHKLPVDLVSFYELCGGIVFDGGPDQMDYSILSPSNFIRGNPKFEVADDGDINDAWYLLVDVSDGNYLAIDCSCEYSGYCCEAFMFEYANRYSSPIVSRNFTELLFRLASYDGSFFFWREDGFKSFGSMYDFKGKP